MVPVFVSPSRIIKPARLNNFHRLVRGERSARILNTMAMNKKLAAFVNPSAFKVAAWNKAIGASARINITHLPTGSRRMANKVPAR